MTQFTGLSIRDPETRRLALSRDSETPKPLTFDSATGVVVIEQVESIVALWTVELITVETVPSDFIPDDFCGFVADRLEERDLTNLHVAKRHMLSATFMARYALEQLFAGFCGHTLMQVLRFLQDIELSRASPESEMEVARATDETEAAASTPAAASEADEEGDELQTTINDLLRADAELSTTRRFEVKGLAQTLFYKIANRVLLPHVAGSNLKDGMVDLIKVQNNFFASRVEFDAVTARADAFFFNIRAFWNPIH